MIKTINLQKIFKTEEVETWALNNVSIEVKQGEFVAIMGPSGCGKSTLLNILGLLDNPTGGEYYLNGIEVSKYTESQRTSLRKGVIGFVFQSFNLIDELNVQVSRYVVSFGYGVLNVFKWCLLLFGEVFGLNYLKNDSG